MNVSTDVSVVFFFILFIFPARALTLSLSVSLSLDFGLSLRVILIPGLILVLIFHAIIDITMFSVTRFCVSFSCWSWAGSVLHHKGLRTELIKGCWQGRGGFPRMLLGVRSVVSQV